MLGENHILIWILFWQKKQKNDFEKDFLSWGIMPMENVMKQRY